MSRLFNLLISIYLFSTALLGVQSGVTSFPCGGRYGGMCDVLLSDDPIDFWTSISVQLIISLLTFIVFIRKDKG